MKPRLTAMDWATIRVQLTAQLLKLGAPPPNVIFLRRRDAGDESERKPRRVA